MSIPLPGHLQQFAHPVGHVVWASIMALDTGLQHELLERLELLLGEALDDPDKPGRQQRAIRALRCAAGVLGRSPSVKAYRRLRDETHDPLLIPVSSITSALGAGSWNEALSLAALPASSDQTRMPVVVSKSPSRYNQAECIAALRGCGEDLGLVPSETMYRRWVARPDVRRRPGRRPLTPTPFVRFFGSFVNALAAAGLISEKVPAYASIDMRVRSGSYAYTDEEYVAALHEARERLGCVPRSRHYGRLREEIIAESFAAGEPRTVPSYGAFLKRYEGWNAALVAAGMAPFEFAWEMGEADGAIADGVRVMWTEDELIAKIRECCEECRGAQTTLEEYVIWRRLELKRRSEEGRKRKIPSKSVVSARLGGWTRAMQRAFPKS